MTSSPTTSEVTAVARCSYWSDSSGETTVYARLSYNDHLQWFWRLHTNTVGNVTDYNANNPFVVFEKSGQYHVFLIAENYYHLAYSLEQTLFGIEDSIGGWTNWGGGF